MNERETKPGGHGSPWFAWLLAAIALALVVGGIESAVKAASAWTAPLLLVAGLALVVIAVWIGRKR